MLVDQSDDATRDNGIMTVDNGGTFAVQVDGAALTALQLIDDPVQVLGTDTFTEAASKGVTLGAVRRDADTSLVNTTNEFAPLQVDALGRLKVEVFSGETLPVSLTTTAVTNAGTFVVQENGAALTALQLIDDTVATDGAAAPTKGVMLAGTDGTNAQTVKVDTSGELQVDVLSSALPTGASTLAEQQTQTTHLSNTATSLSVLDDWDNAASDGASVSGDVAHDAADAGEPVKIGAFAETAPSGRTPVADGDRTNLIAGADGVLLVRPYCALEDIVSGVDTDTAGDSTAVISAPGAGIRLYITSVVVKNTHASTDAYIDIRDGAAGSVLATIPAPAAGGAVVTFPVPLRLTANTACAVDPSAAVTTIITTVVGFKAAV